jgi:hypothetical protein
MQDRPDAVKFPSQRGFGGKVPHAQVLPRFFKIIDRAEAYLKVDRAKGEKGYVRTQPVGNFHFATRGVSDSLLFPTGHDLEGAARYNWVSQEESGVEFGYLVDAAKEPVGA